MSSRMMKAGCSANSERTLTMLRFAFCVTPIYLTRSVDNPWVAIGVIGRATTAHQAFSTNLCTLPSDIFPVVQSVPSLRSAA